MQPYELASPLFQLVLSRITYLQMRARSVLDGDCLAMALKREAVRAGHSAKLMGCCWGEGALPLCEVAFGSSMLRLLSKGDVSTPVIAGIAGAGKAALDWTALDWTAHASHGMRCTMFK